MSTAEIWAKRMTASFASGLSSGYSFPPPRCTRHADEEEEASRPNRPVRSGRTLKPESDDDSGVEETFERARGEAQRRGYGRQATKADSARGFERNKQKLAESLTSANKDLQRIEKEDTLYKKLYMHADNASLGSSDPTEEVHASPAWVTKVEEWTKSGGQSPQHLPPLSMETASWRIRASSAMPSRDSIPPRPHIISKDFVGGRQAHVRVPQGKTRGTGIPQYHESSQIIHRSATRSGLVLDAGEQAVEDTKFAVESGFSSLLSTVDFIGDGLKSAAGAPSAAARGITQMGSSSGAKDESKVTRESKYEPSLTEPCSLVQHHTQTRELLSLSAAISRRGAQNHTSREQDSSVGIMDPLATAGYVKSTAEGNAPHNGLHDTHNTAWTRNTYDTDSGLQPLHASDLESQQYASNVATSSPDRTFILVDAVGSRPGELMDPKGIAIDTSRNLVVVDSGNHRVQIFKNTGEFLRVFGKGPGKGPGEFNSPWGVAVDARNGNLVVSDTNNHRIQIFSQVGIHLKTFGTYGSAKGQLCFPHGVAVSSNGEILVADTCNSRVCVFSGLSSSWEGGGKPLKTYTGTTIMSTSMDLPSHIQMSCPLGLAVSERGDAVVSDWKSSRLLFLGTDGFPKPPVGSTGDGPAEFYGPASIAFDRNHQILVCDHANQRLQVLQQSGAHVRTFSSLTIMDKEKLTGTFLQLSNPVGVAVSDVGDIFVSDSGHSLICRIPPDSSAI